MCNRLLLCLALLTVLALPASAQTPSGEISGTVVDSSGSVLPGVRVTLTNSGTNAVRLTQTNETGVYVFPAVPPGTYSLKVELEGFSTAQQTGINVQVGSANRFPFTMAIGAVDRRRVGCCRHARDTDGERVDRHGHREPQHRRVAAERPQLPAAGVADSGRHDERSGVGTGTAAHGRPAEQLLAERRRPAHPLQPLLARRRREHRPQLQQLYAAALSRRARGIQSRVGHLRRRVRTRRRADQREHQVGHERLPRNRVRVRAERQDGLEELLRPERQAHCAFFAEPVRGDHRRSGPQQQAVLHVQLGRAARREVAHVERIASADRLESRRFLQPARREREPDRHLRSRDSRVRCGRERRCRPDRVPW